MFQINKFSSVTSKKFKTQTFSEFSEFANAIASQGVKQVESKKQAEAMVFAELNAVDGGRTKENMGKTQVVVLDVDTISQTEGEKLLENIAPYDYILHETYGSTEDKPRFRIILPLDKPVSGHYYANNKLASRAAALLGIPEIDDASNNPVQAFYVPSAPIGEEREVFVEDGKQPLSLDALLAVELKQVKTTKQSKTDDDESVSATAVKEIAEAKRIVQDCFNGQIMHHNNRFWVYNDSKGDWEAFNDSEMLQSLMLTVYDSRQKLANVKDVMNHLKILTYIKEFPTSKRKNGVIVLESCAVEPLTGKKLKHSPKHYAKNKLGFDYVPEATCPQWLEFLEQVFRDDKDKAEKIALLQEFTGLSLTPIMRFQKMLWLIGAGSNGKGVIFDIVRELIGPENCSALPQSNFGHRFGLEQLEGKLANLDPEMSVTAVLADAKIKSVVGGDVISLEKKMEPVYQARLFAKLWAAANSLPVTKDSSHGFFRRVLILTFNRVFLESEQDRQLTDKLREELPGIFNWALEGLHRLLKNDGFTVPESSVQELEEYKVNSNDVDRFKREHLVDLVNVVPANQCTKLEDIYPHYQTFCRANGMNPVNSSAFGQQLKALGVIKRKSGNFRYYPVKVINMNIYQTDGFMSRPAPQLVSVEEGFEDAA